MKALFLLKRKICLSGSFRWDRGFRALMIRVQWQKPWGQKGAGYRMKELNIIYQGR